MVLPDIMKLVTQHADILQVFSIIHMVRGATLPQLNINTSVLLLIVNTLNIKAMHGVRGAITQIHNTDERVPHPVAVVHMSTIYIIGPQ